MSTTPSAVGAPDAGTQTATYAYGVVRSGSPAPRLRGVADAAVESVAHGHVSLLFSAVSDVPIRARRRDLIAHSDVLIAALESGPVLPLRFGTVFGDPDEAVARFLEPRHA